MNFLTNPLFFNHIICLRFIKTHGLQANSHAVCGALLAVSLSLSSTCSFADIIDISRIYKQTPSLSQFDICQGGGCAAISTLSLNPQEWQQVAGLFDNVKTAEEERQKIALAIGVLEEMIGKKIGTSADLAGTFFDGKLAGQQDCNDEAINSTTYMRLLKTNGLIKLHEIEDMRTRNFFFTGWPHSTAVIRDIKTTERYAVDSWFYDNGHAATIVPFKTWKANFVPTDSPINKSKVAKQ